MAPHTTNDETAIEELHRKFADAWSRGDTNAVVELFTDDCVRVGARGDRQDGHEELRAAFGRLLSGPFAGAKVTITTGTIRFLAADVALYQGPIEIVPDGDQPILRGYSVDVMKKIGDRWLILETHPKLFPIER